MRRDPHPQPHTPHRVACDSSIQYVKENSFYFKTKHKPIRYLLVNIMKKFLFTILLLSSFTSLLIVSLLLTMYIKIFFLKNSGRLLAHKIYTIYIFLLTKIVHNFIVFFSVFLYLYRDIRLTNRKCI